MNTSDKKVESQFLRRIPTYGDEPSEGVSKGVNGGVKMGKIEFNDSTYRENPAIKEMDGAKRILEMEQVHLSKIRELIRENEELKKMNAELGGVTDEWRTRYGLTLTLYYTERKRSARWKKVARKYYAISQAWIGD